MWMRLSHPNVVRCLGATANPPQIVMNLMSNGEVMDYIRRDRNANRVHLVSAMAFAGKELIDQCDAVNLGIGFDRRA